MSYHFNTELFGRRMREARLNAHLTQDEASAKSGISQSNISTYERGALPIIDTAMALADLYGVSVSWLAGMTDDPKGTR